MHLSRSQLFNPIQNLDFFFVAFRLKAEAEQQKKDEEKARREYIRNEYLRKKQLKLMVDMDEVIKPRSGSLKKKPRPKSIHRDVMEPPAPLVKATGERRAVMSRDTQSRPQQPLIHVPSVLTCPVDALQGYVLEASPYRAFLWRLSTWRTTTETSQITGRATGKTHSLSSAL